MMKLDAKNQILGRLASKVAKLLIQGERIEVSNINKIKQTSKNKIYYRHTGYPGGIREKSYDKVDKDWAFRHAVMGMLPKNKLRKQRIKCLNILKP